MYNGKYIMAEHFRELSVFGKRTGAATSRSFCAFLTVLSSFGRTIFCPSFCWLAKVIHFMIAHFSLYFTTTFRPLMMFTPRCGFVSRCPFRLYRCPLLFEEGVVVGLSMPLTCPTGPSSFVRRPAKSMVLVVRF